MISLKFIQIVALLSVFSVILGSCSNQETIKSPVSKKIAFREISASEVGKFIPFNYSLVEDSVYGAELEKLDLDKDGMLEVILYTASKDGCNWGNARLVILKYDPDSDAWKQMWAQDTTWNVVHTWWLDTHQDVNNDWVPELIAASESSGCGSGWTTFKQIWSFSGGQFLELSNWKAASQMGGDQMIEVVGPTLDVLERIIDSPESRHNCARYSLKTYIYTWNEYKLLWDYQTKYRYLALEGPERLIEEDCFTTDTLVQMLSYAKKDAKWRVYPKLQEEGIIK